MRIKTTLLLLASLAFLFGNLCPATAQTPENDGEQKYLFGGVIAPKNIGKGIRFYYNDKDQADYIQYYESGKLKSWDKNSYNEKGQLALIVKFLDYQGGEPKEDMHIKYEFDEKGHLSKRLFFMLGNFTTPFTTADIKCDEKGRIISYFDHTANTSVKYEYDAQGNLVKDSNISHDGGNDRLIAFIEYKYDEKNQRIEERKYPQVIPGKTPEPFSIVNFTYLDNGCLDFLSLQIRAKDGEMLPAGRIGYKYNTKVSGENVYYPPYPLEMDSPYMTYAIMTFGKPYMRTEEWSYSGEDETPYLKKAYEYRYPNSIKKAISTETRLRVYPNPVTDLLVVDGLNLSKVSLINSLGETVVWYQVDADRLEIPVSSLPRGVYMVQVEAEHAREFFKVLLK